MFRGELEELQTQFSDRLVVVHSLSKPKTSWFSSKKEFEFREGRVDDKTVHWFINEYPPYAQNAEYYICGPGKMIESTRHALQKIDVPDERVFIEHFGGGEGVEVDNGVSAKLTATIDGEVIHTQIEKGKTVLRALLDNGNNPPYSCEGGVCSSCLCKLKKGKVVMKKNLALSDSEVEKGYILSCQSIPVTEEIEVEYTKK